MRYSEKMGRRELASGTINISIGRLHPGAYAALRGHRFMALRCGRRFGKTELAKAWISEGLVSGMACAWIAPQHMLAQEVYYDLAKKFPALVEESSKASLIRLRTGGRLDFWSLDNDMAGRSRGYQRIVIDEAALAKNGDNRTAGSMMAIWERSIKPTLYDYGGQALVCSNAAGKEFDNFFYNICTDPKHGFHEHHATTMDNPLLPKRLGDESEEDWLRRREQFRADLISDNDPLVYAQEHLAEFVDWSGAAFFDREKMLVDNRPVSFPSICDAVFAVIDAASKTGTDNDATAVAFFAVNKHFGGAPLLILDWGIAQIEGAILESWLPSVFDRLEELRACVGRSKVPGAHLSRTRTPARFCSSKPADAECPPIRSNQSSRQWARTNGRFPSPATCTAGLSNTLSTLSTNPSSTSGALGIICLIKSRASVSATRTVTEKTTSSTPSATASPSPLEIAKGFREWTLRAPLAFLGFLTPDA